jgi:hypothetical protein
MRGISKAMLRSVGGLAVAGAIVAGGTGLASAAPASHAVHTTSSISSCYRFSRQQWNLSGPNSVEAVYMGTTYTYSVSFRQFGGCLVGTLTDPYYPTTGPVFGTVFRNHVVFSFRYPYGSIQGTRTYVGSIGRFGSVSGFWFESGSEHGSGTWSLARNAFRIHRFGY